MTTLLKITAFDINRCGYYAHRKNSPEFGEIIDILGGLLEWVKGKSLQETLTFEPDGEESLKTYCFDISRGIKSGGYLLTTWNEIPMSDRGVKTANASAAVGKVKVEIADVANGNIPGYPSYFYFIPTRNLVFSIRPANQHLNGHQGLLRLMKGFLEKSSQYVVFNSDSDTDDFEIIGYQNNGQIRPLDKITANFHSSPRRLPGEEIFLRANLKQIRKMVKRDKLDLGQKENKSLINSLLELSGILKAQTFASEMTFKYEIDYAPNIKEFEQLVKKFKENDDGTSEVGFKLTGHPEVHWLSHTQAKSEIELNISTDKSGMLSPSDLVFHLEKSAIAKLLQTAGLSSKD